MSFFVEEPLFSEETLQQVLATELPVHNDAGVKDIQQYLCLLLEKVWHEGEGFNGKRPFGNSGWEWDLYEALADARLISAKFAYDPDDGTRDVVDVDKKKGNQLINAAIRYAFLGTHGD